MSDEPEPTNMGARLRERTQPIAPDDAAHGWAHAYLCEALGRMLEQVADVFDPEGDVPPLAPILDPDLCPAWALPWLAQLVGVQLPAGVSESAARTLIKDVSGFKRGTPDALRAAAGMFLTGSQTVYFRERDGGDAYRLEVVTRTGETPDPAAVLAALMAQKPGGIVLGYRTIETWDYQEMSRRGGTYSQQSAAYASYRDLALDHPVSSP